VSDKTILSVTQESITCRCHRGIDKQFFARTQFHHPSPPVHKPPLPRHHPPQTL
jgi:hypothetical protein